MNLASGQPAVTIPTVHDRPARPGWFGVDADGYSARQRVQPGQAETDEQGGPFMADMTTPARPRSAAARTFTILGLVFAVLAIFLFPLLLGLVAVVLGIVGGALGDRPLGWYAAGAGVIGAILGIVLANVLLSA
jgi:hypothetical protein